MTGCAEIFDWHSGTVILAAFWNGKQAIGGKTGLRLKI
jgi:hypothetical protein